MKHSPGPFSIGALRSCEVEILDAKGCEVARVGVPVGRVHGVDACEAQDANAALLSAAPELLSALIVANDWLADKGVAFEHPEAVRIRAAIAKAEGGVV